MWVDMPLFFNPELIVPTLTWEHDFLSFSLSTTLYLDACTSHTPKLVSYQLARQPQHLYFTFNFLCPSTWGLPRTMSMTFVPHGFKRGFYYHRMHFVILHNHEWASDWNPYALVIPNIMIILSLTLVGCTMCDRFLSILFSEVGPSNSIPFVPHPFSPTTCIVGRKAKVDDTVLLKPPQ